MEQQSPMKFPAPNPPGARPERERTERSAHSDWRRRRTVGSESTPFVGKKSMLLDVGVVPGDLPLDLLPKLLATRGVARNRFELTGTQGTMERVIGDRVQIEARLCGELNELLVHLELDPDLRLIVHQQALADRRLTGERSGGKRLALGTAAIYRTRGRQTDHRLADSTQHRPHPGPSIVSGRTTASNSSAVTWPERTASSFRVVPFLCADFAIAAALS